MLRERAQVLALMQYEPSRRMSAADALKHPFMQMDLPVPPSGGDGGGALMDPTPEPPMLTEAPLEAETGDDMDEDGLLPGSSEDGRTGFEPVPLQEEEGEQQVLLLQQHQEPEQQQQQWQQQDLEQQQGTPGPFPASGQQLPGLQLQPWDLVNEMHAAPGTQSNSGTGLDGRRIKARPVAS